MAPVDPARPTCPECFSNNLEHEEVEILERTIKRKFICLACGKIFYTEAPRSCDPPKENVDGR